VVESSTKTREYFARPVVTFEIVKPQQFHAEPYICASLARRPSRLKLNPTDGQVRSTPEVGLGVGSSHSRDEQHFTDAALRERGLCGARVLKLLASADRDRHLTGVYGIGDEGDARSVLL